MQGRIGRYAGVGVLGGCVRVEQGGAVSGRDYEISGVWLSLMYTHEHINKGVYTIT